jgi:RHS repeat-associated protein
MCTLLVGSLQRIVLVDCTISDATEQHFTGKERDSESGLDYFGARYMSSSMGRFMSPDPSGLYYADPRNPQSLNLYTYGLNNPLSNIDPTGLTCQTNSSDGNTYDDGDGKGCDIVDQQDADRLKNGQYSATVYGGANAAALEARDAVSAFVMGGNKATIQYLPQDPFTLNFQRSLGMQAILAKVKGNCSASSGSGGVGTGEAAVNSAIDHLTGQPSIAEDQLGGFTYSYSQQGGTLNVTVSNPITLNSLAYHALASNQEDVNGNVISDSTVLAGDTMAGSGIDRLGRLTGSVPFGRVDQQLQIQAANPCK